MEDSENKQLYICFSHLLDYPTADLGTQTQTCIDLLKKNHAEAAEQMTKFLEFVENKELGYLEEVYTGTFDVNPACHIFAGHLLFGESFKRGAFMSGLEQEYKEHGFDTKVELSDHVPVLFRFVSSTDSDFANDLLKDCLIPVFDKMNTNFEDDSLNPYMPVLRTVSLVLNNIFKGR
ncbi:nitrate reductase molybdenum cofactor assembly chaperone [Candidatus Halobeggiatoa sp. HSG11]|nr:nitrate reductase molybdenum cofactor assembly chaperone [Candidatus Halobeggiatoa sp. HSG11]